MKIYAGIGGKAFCAALLVSLRIGIVHTSAIDRYVPEEYQTIQSAVDASEAGDCIRLAPGIYQEQVVIAFKNLKLVGEPGVILRANAGMIPVLSSYGWLWEPLVGIYRSQVDITNVAFEGAQLGDLYIPLPSNPSNNRLIALYFLASGGSVSACSFSGFRGTSVSRDSLVYTIYAFNPNSAGSSAVNLHLQGNQFEDNEVSIFLRGDPGPNPGTLRLSAQIRENSIFGLQGAFSDLNFGLWMVNGVRADILTNFVAGHYGTSNWLSAGVVAYDAAAQTHGQFIPLFPVTFEGNTLSNNGLHLLIVGGDQCRIANNNFLRTSLAMPSNWGALALSGDGAMVENNNFVETPVGVVLLGDETLGEGWPPMVPATNITLFGNWFCNVPEGVRTQALVTGVSVHGTETCVSGSIRPRFQSITASGDVRNVRLRRWHDVPVVIEVSPIVGPSNLVQWLPVHTNVMATPLVEFQDNVSNALTQRFYRARKP